MSGCRSVCPVFESADIVCLTAGFLESCHIQQERHAELSQPMSAHPRRVPAHKFEQSYIAYTRVHANLTSLPGLGIQGMPTDALRNRPVCAQLPAGQYEAHVYALSVVCLHAWYLYSTRKLTRLLLTTLQKLHALPHIVFPWLLMPSPSLVITPTVARLPETLLHWSTSTMVVLTWRSSGVMLRSPARSL